VGSESFIKTNTWGVFNFLESVRESPNILKYVQVSTDEVYGSLDLNTKEKFTEGNAFAPNIPYSATKAGGDLLCRAYYSTWHLPVVVTHCSNNFGPYQYPEKLIPFFIVRMLEGKKLPLYGDGRHVRDWIYVRDHCEALVTCLTSGKPGEVYNIGSGHELPNREIAQHILHAFGRDDSWIEFVPDRPGHDRRYALHTEKIERELGWKPRTAFADAFRMTVEWYRSHGEWINAVRERTGVFNPHIDLWKGHQLDGRSAHAKRD
jgi:dTDP-glucose 4,6-dehydratase